MRKSPLFWLSLLACDGGGATPDANVDHDGSVRDDAFDARADAPLDAPLDAPPDAPPDSMIDDCPNRTAGVGEPSLPISQAEVRSGNVTIRTAIDISLLAGIRYVDGNVTIDTTTLTEIVLPDLEAVRGMLSVSTTTTSLTRLDLPELETVGGSIVERSASTVVLLAPRFETMGGAVEARVETIDIHCLKGLTTSPGTLWNAGLTSSTLDLSKLERANIRLSDNPSLTALRLPRLVEGFVNLGRSVANSTSMPLLATVELPVLQRAGELVFDDLPALVQVTLDAANVGT